MDLAPKQLDAVRDGHAVRIHLPELGPECVLALGDIYDRVQRVIGDDEVALGWEAGRKIGWDSPEMAEYDDYDAHRP